MRNLLVWMAVTCGMGLFVFADDFNARDFGDADIHIEKGKYTTL